MKLIEETQRMVAEIDFDHATLTGAKIGNRSVHQFWHIFAAQFRTVLMAPQRRPESGTVSWGWRQPVGNHPFTVQELAEVRRRLVAGNRSLLGGSMAAEIEDDDGAGTRRRIDGQVRASVSAMAGQMLRLSDESLSRYLGRTELGPMVHSWGSADPAEPYAPDSLPEQTGSQGSQKDQPDGEERSERSGDAATQTRPKRKKWLLYVSWMAGAVILAAGAGWYFRHKADSSQAAQLMVQGWQAASGDAVEVPATGLGKSAGPADGWTDLTAKKVPRPDVAGRQLSAVAAWHTGAGEDKEKPHLNFERSDKSPTSMPELSMTGNQAGLDRPDEWLPKERSQPGLLNEEHEQRKKSWSSESQPGAQSPSAESGDGFRRETEQPAGKAVVLFRDEVLVEPGIAAVGHALEMQSRAQAGESSVEITQNGTNRRGSGGDIAYDGDGGGSTDGIVAGKATKTKAEQSSKNPAPEVSVFVNRGSASADLRGEYEPALDMNNNPGAAGTVVIDAGDWNVELVADAILPTRPVPRKKGTSDLPRLRERELSKRRLAMPAAFQSPFVTVGLMMNWDEDFTKGEPRWVKTNGADGDAVKVSVSSAEMSWNPAKPSEGDYRLMNNKGVEIARVTISAGGRWLLVLADGVRTAYRVSIACEAHEQKSARYEWRVAGRQVSAVYKNSVHGFSFEFPLEIACQAGATIYPVALLETSSGWSLSSRLTIRQPGSHR